MEARSKLDKIDYKARKSYIRYAVGLPVVVFATLTVLQLFFTKSFYQPGMWIFWFTLPASIIVGVMQGRKVRQPKHMQIIYSVSFHLIIALFLIFAAPQNSGYIFAWVLLVFGIQVNFGKKAIFLSYIALILTQLATAAYRGSYDVSVLINGAIELVLIFVVCQLMLQSRRSEQNELKELTHSLNRELFERQRLLSLINNMGEAVIATDTKGKIILYNAAVLNLLDTNQSLEEKTIDNILNLKDAKHKTIKLFSLLKDNSVGFTSTDYVHQFAPNDVINMYINVASVKLGFKEESESGYIIIMRDITKEKSLEEERDEFISVVSHELRTPVAIAEGNISNAVFMTSRNKTDKIVSESLNQAHEQVLFLANMINDLATLSRAERTDVEVEISTVDLTEMLHGVARDYESEAAAKKIKLTATAAKDLKNINTSELYLQEILQNFVTNAIKYTKSGHIIVHARTNKNGDAVFSVADSGIGLSKSDQKRVFDKFFRSEDYRTRESSGTGLGLYVTSKLAHRINAQITLESELNKGTTFTITVPSLKLPKNHQK